MIHPTAIIHSGARLAEGVKVGPYSVIGEFVEIGEGTEIGPHVVIDGHTRIGKYNQIFQFCSLGARPQDKKYANEPTQLDIGDHNMIREFCSFNTGTVQDVGVTRLGSHNWIMAYVHLAHDCQVGNHTILANNSQLAGHVHVEDWAILGAFTIAHQFVRVGAHAFTGMGTVLLQDVPPYVTASGNPPAPHGINAEGLKRRGYSAEAVMAIKRAYKTLYRQGLTLAEAQNQLAAQTQQHAEIQLMLDFLAISTRGIVR